MTADAHRKAWTGKTGAAAPRVRTDDSIGRPEDIGTHPAARPKSTRAKTAPRAPAAGPARTRPIRITVDLDAAAYKELNQWLGTAAAEVGAPVSKAQALRAMIRAASLDKSTGLVVIDLLRRHDADH